jgi:AmmeMemoRadiSam system protein A
VGKVPIVPILVGAATERAQARAMAKRLADLIQPGTIVVISSDFTHHGRSYGYAPFAREADMVEKLLGLGRATAARASAIDPRGFWSQVDVADDTVCGARPIEVLLELLDHAFSGSGTVVDVTTSAAVSHSTDQIVTYAGVDFVGTWAPWQEKARAPHLGTLTADEQKAALALARATLQTHLGHAGELASWFAANKVEGNLAAIAGVFVTVNNTGEKLAREGKLRGCIGTLEAREPLVDSIIHAAVSAAHDPRFPALERDELPYVALEVSVLSPMRPVPSANEIELGKHGVLLGKAGRHAVFLPQVATETRWDLATFLSQLSLKAGLPRDAWREGATFEVFTAQVFHEAE